MTAAPSPSSATSPAPVTTAGEADILIARFSAVMEQLIAVVTEETALIREGRLAAAATLQEAKDDLTRRYIADAGQLQSDPSQLRRIPADEVVALRQRHSAFRAVLQTNLTVLATAHAVSEGIVRGVSGEMARKSTPQIYGASGRALAAPRNLTQPLAVSWTF